MASDKPIRVVGGGFGGLSAAIALASVGKRVILHEKQEQLGGKASSRTIGAFRFDTGPSLLTLPVVFERLFALSGHKMENYIPIVPLSPLTHYWFSDHTHFTSDLLERFIPTLTKHLSVTEKEVSRYFSHTKKIWEITNGVFLEKSLHTASTYLSKNTLGSLLGIGYIDAFRSMHTANATSFSDSRMIQLLDRYGTYNGSDPYKAPATLNMISYVEHGLGGFGVSNGIYGIIEGMEKLARELGVEIETKSEVEKILYNHSNRHIEGLLIAGEKIECDCVVSGVDVSTLYEKLLDDTEAPLAQRYRRLAPSSSALVFYWGIDRSFNQLGLHNIFFSSDYKREFEQIHRFSQVPLEPTIYINITSKLTPTDAPLGQENWFVLVNAPCDDGRDWQAELHETRMHIINRLSNILDVDLGTHVVAEDSWTPRQIADETGSYRGSLYGISSNTKMAAFLRHPNFSRRYRGLYLCGGSVHPGGGMPLSVQSGMIAAELLLKRKY
ncbi:phytoene desaturase family protein [Pleomorphochaeta sp. DL1XJH-081]|uniref:phytoene desaturase family protein n=1 Tax=Pleomorphochaeta sp. DL1XJH-081 TaxID=3409690 RepID=UPI003BB659D5